MPVSPLPVDASPTKRPLPDKASQTRSKGIMRELYAPQLADRTAQGREKLANTLMAESRKLISNPVDQFVLLIGAIEASKEAGRLQLCVTASDELARNFEIDRVSVVVQALSEMKLATTPPNVATENLSAGITLFDELLADEAFVEATRLLMQLQTLSASSPAAKAAIQLRGRDLNYLRGIRDRLPSYLERLKVQPSDPEASLAVGRYYCISRGEWDTGLPLLAAGTNPELKSLASSDMARPTQSTRQASLGDAWWDAAAREPAGPAQNSLRQRAAFWYRKVLESGQPAGLSKSLIEKRLAEVVQAPTAQPTELLRTMKANEKVRNDAGVLALAKGGRIETLESFKTPVAFKVQLITDGKDMRFAYGADQIIFNWEMNANELRVDGGPANGRHKGGGAGRVPVNAWVTIDLIVQTDEMLIRVQGEERYRVKADFSKVNKPLTISAARGELRIKSLTVQPAP